MSELPLCIASAQAEMESKVKFCKMFAGRKVKVNPGTVEDASCKLTKGGTNSPQPYNFLPDL